VNCEGCDGRCCSVFFFPRTPREIAEKIEQDGAFNGNDGRMVQDMLVPLTTEEANARAERFGVPAKMISKDHMFTCRHWDEDTRLCTVYEHRPDLCRDFPYGKACPNDCGAEGGQKMTHNENATILSMH
jgi:Fe-S-cluster containining protein